MANWTGTLTNAYSTGTSTGSNTAASFNNTSAVWPNLVNQMIRITAGIGIGQERYIQSNTTTIIIITSIWDIIPDSSSQYEIVLKFRNGDHITGNLSLGAGYITELEDSATIYFDGLFYIIFINNVTIRWNKSKTTLVTFTSNLSTTQGKAGFWNYIYCQATCSIYPIRISYIKIIDAVYGLRLYGSVGLGDGVGIHHIWTKNLTAAFLDRGGGTDNTNVSMSYFLNEGSNIAPSKLVYNDIGNLYAERYDNVWCEDCIGSGITFAGLTSPLIQIMKNSVWKNSYSNSITNIRADANKRIHLIDSYFSTKGESAIYAQGTSVNALGITSVSRNVSLSGKDVSNIAVHSMRIVSKYNDYTGRDCRSDYAFDVTTGTVTSDSDFISGRLRANPNNVDTTESTTSTASPQQYRGLSSARTRAKTTRNKLLEIDNIIVSNIQSNSVDISFDCKNSHTGTTVDQDSLSGQNILYVASTSDFEILETIEIAFGTGRKEEANIISITAGVSLTLESNLLFSHTAIQADVVKKQLRNWGLPFIKYGTVSGQYGYETPTPDSSNWGSIFCGFEDTFYGKIFEWKKWGHTFSLTGLSAGTLYYVKCFAYTPLGEIMESPEISFTTDVSISYTDPGIDNVRDGVTYKFDSIDQTGLLDIPIISDVRDGIFYDNLTKEGTLDLPLEIDVRDGTVYDNGTKTGELQSGISQADIDKIALTVWDESVTGHSVVSSFGVLMKRTIGLMQENFRLYDTEYYLDQYLQSGKIRIYPSASDVDTDTNALATYTINASYDPDQKTLTEYKVKKI